MIGITYGREIISARNSYGNTGVKNSTIAEVVQGEEGRRKKYACKLGRKCFKNALN